MIALTDGDTGRAAQLVGDGAAELDAAPPVDANWLYTVTTLAMGAWLLDDAEAAACSAPAAAPGCSFALAGPAPTAPCCRAPRWGCSQPCRATTRAPSVTSTTPVSVNERGARASLRRRRALRPLHRPGPRRGRREQAAELRSWATTLGRGLASSPRGTSRGTSDPRPQRSRSVRVASRSDETMPANASSTPDHDSTTARPSRSQRSLARAAPRPGTSARARRRRQAGDGEQTIVVAVLLAASLSRSSPACRRPVPSSSPPSRCSSRWRGGWCSQRAPERDLVLDLVVQGREDLPLRLGRARAPASAGPQAPRPAGTCAGRASRGGRDSLVRRSSLPLYSRRVVAAVAPELDETAQALRRSDASVRGVALERAAPERTRLAAVRGRRRSAARGAPARPLPLMLR